VALFESEGNYTRLHFGSSRPLVHRSLRDLDTRLDPRAFFRANRRQILNLRQVSRMEPSSRGGLVVTLENGLDVEMSRRQAQRFRSLMSL
jgi:two-component system LytT family response regulator